MDWKRLHTCVAPEGAFVFGVHRPRFRAANLREADFIGPIGFAADGSPVENRKNFPEHDIEEPGADPVIEIANPFPFRGATFILQRSADRAAQDPGAIRLPGAAPVSLTGTLKETLDDPAADRVFMRLPGPLKIALAVTSTDAEDLVRLARSCCAFVDDPDTGLPLGLRFKAGGKGRRRPEIDDAELFEALANNPYLPDVYKEAMVLRPGVQGGSEIVGDWEAPANGGRVFEYLRRNSYIPWGHYAANMAHDAVRYRIGGLKPADVVGMRHLYYQRTYVRLAEMVGSALSGRRQRLDEKDLESLRRRILKRIAGKNEKDLTYSATLWGWNFGFDYAPSGYRLHASHQQVHQQYALVPSRVPESGDSAPTPAYACGDLVADFCRRYRRLAGRPFFESYLEAIGRNRRIDGHPSRPASLVVHEDSRCMLFVPKAQTSKWELQLMTTGAVGNVLEADTEARRSLDRGILLAAKILEKMGARMITTIEYAKRFAATDPDQRLLYVFLPRLPESPGAFSEAQLRWINGHYPEDFAAACRAHLDPVLREMEKKRKGGPDS